MKRIQKYIKNIGFVILALVGVTFVVVYASGTKNILYDGWYPLTWDRLSQSNSGFKLGINDYMIMEKDTVNHTCSYYQGLTANKVYIPNFKEGELDTFKTHFPTGFVENQTVGTPYCYYEDEFFRPYTPVGCYSSSGMSNLSWPNANYSDAGTTYYNNNNASISWNCPPVEENPCEEIVSCNVIPCSTNGCAAGTFTEGVDDAHRSCNFEDPNIQETYHDFSCDVPDVCGGNIGDCLGNTVLNGTPSGLDWNCQSNGSYGNTSCSITVCASSYQGENNSSCAGGASYVDYSYDGNSSWQCDFEGTSYSCPGN